VIAGTLLLASLSAALAVFCKIMDHLELLGDFIGIAAAYASFRASQILLPLRRSSNNSRIPALAIAGLALFISICLALEFGIGAAWYTLDKLVRHYQHS